MIRRAMAINPGGPSENAWSYLTEKMMSISLAPSLYFMGFWVAAHDSYRCISFVRLLVDFMVVLYVLSSLFVQI